MTFSICLLMPKIKNIPGICILETLNYYLIGHIPDFWI